jgi:hypothetical protein
MWCMNSRSGLQPIAVSLVDLFPRRTFHRWRGAGAGDLVLNLLLLPRSHAFRASLLDVCRIREALRQTRVRRSQSSMAHSIVALRQHSTALLQHSRKLRAHAAEARARNAKIREAAQRAQLSACKRLAHADAVLRRQNDQENA